MSRKKHRGLGRGLDALLASTSETPAAEGTAPGGELRSVPVEAIRPNPYQPRQSFAEEELEELSASIREHGLLQPLVLMEDEGEDGFTLIAGERRWRAAQRAGLDEVPALLRQAEPREMLAIAIIENVQRADLDPIESAEAYQRLRDEFGATQADVARLVGKSRTAVANTMRLLGLAPDVRALVSAGHLSEGHGRALLGVTEPEAQLRMAKRAIREGWTVRRTEREAREASAPSPSARPEAARGASEAEDPNTAAARKALEAALGTRVEIRRRGEGGQLVLHFYSEEDLAALYDRLGGEAG